jgi:CHAD domain-containing protein
MAYRLKRGRPIESELRRIAAKQLGLAITELRAIGDRKSDEAVHEARRRVKKVRALIRLVESTLGRSYGSSNKRLRSVNRLLAPVADGEAVVETLDRLAKRYQNELSHHTLASMRRELVDRRGRIDRQANADRVLQKGISVLRTELKHVPTWRVNAHGFHAVSRGLKKTVREAKRAMRLAAADPTADNYHVWRRRSKDHWFHVRLLEARCGGALIADERDLEALDDCLGEHHNCALLQTVVSTDAFPRRRDRTHLLRLLRRYETDLRHEAQVLGRKIYRKRPDEFVKRVRKAWKWAKFTEPNLQARTSWSQQAA